MRNHNVEPTLSDNELSEKQLNEVSGGAPVHHSEFTITKLSDAATPKLYEACCKGTHIPDVTIELL